MEGKRGFGLKKWRRIPRDSAPSCSSGDSAGKSVALKRLLSTSVSAIQAAESEGSSRSSTAGSAPPKKPIATPSAAAMAISSKKTAKGKKPRPAADRLQQPTNSVDSNGHDPLFNSLLSLQSLHDALSKEVEMFGEMAAEPHSCSQAKTETELDKEDQDLDSLFTQRIAAEIEYLTISSATRSLKAVAAKQAMIFNELESTAEKQAETLTRLDHTATKAAKLEKEALDIIETEDVLVTRRRVDKVRRCFLTQLVLLALVVWNFVLRFLSNQSGGDFVPT